MEMILLKKVGVPHGSGVAGRKLPPPLIPRWGLGMETKLPGWYWGGGMDGPGLRSGKDGVRIPHVSGDDGSHSPEPPSLDPTDG